MEDGFRTKSLYGYWAKIDGRDITNGDIYELVVYGQYEHGHKLKRQELEKLRSGLTLLFVEISFRQVLVYIHSLVTMLDREFVKPLLKDLGNTSKKDEDIHL